MTQLSELIQGLGYLLARWLDKQKYDNPYLWIGGTLALGLLLAAVHFNWITQMSDWLKITIEGFIVTVLSVKGSRTSQKVSEYKAKKEQQMIPVDNVPPKTEIVQIKPDSEENLEVAPVVVEHPKALQLKLVRHQKNDTSTVGDLYIKDEFFCKVIEDKDRGLKQEMSLEEIKKLKVYGETAIPSGTYQIVLSFSNKFKKLLPELLDVPGYGGIRIHPGNSEKDSLGCLIVGDSYENKRVINSRRTFRKLMSILKANQDTQKMFITIENAS